MQDKRMLRWTAAAAAIVLTATVAACSPGGSGGTAGEDTEGAGVSGGRYEGPKVKIDFWHGWTGGAAPKIVPQLVKQFNAEHPNIEVVQSPTEWGAITQKMALATRSGKGPDVAVQHGDEIATYAAQGLLVGADDIVKDLGYTPEDFPTGLLDAGKYDGAQYAVPWSVTPLGLYVNTDVLKKAGLDTESLPTDRESYLRYLDTLKAKGVKGEWVDGFVFTGLFEFQSLLWQHGGEMFNSDATEATFNSEAGVQALTWMTDLVEKGYSPRDVAANGNINGLVAGDTAFNWNGIWITSYEPLQKVNWTAVPVPQIGPEKAVWSSSTHWVFMKNKDQDPNETAAAATFVQWMNDHSLDWAKVGELPAKNDVRESPELLQKYPRLEPFLGQLEYARYETPAPGIAATADPLVEAINLALLGKKEPKQALDDAAAKATQILRQNAEQYGG